MDRPGRAVWPLVLLASCWGGNDRVAVRPSPLGELPEPVATAPPSSPAPSEPTSAPPAELIPATDAFVGGAPGYPLDSLPEVVARVRPESIRVAVEAVYRGRGGAWVWSDGRRLSAAAGRILALVERAEDHGLRRSLLESGGLGRLKAALAWSDEVESRTVEGDRQRTSLRRMRGVILAEMDAHLSAAALFLARQLGGSRASGADLADQLPRSARLDDWVAGFEPWLPQYERLVRDAMPRYRAYADRGARWPKLWLPEGVHHIGKGGRGKLVSKLRERLEAEGLLGGAPAGDPAFFDAGLRDDLRRFQYTRGLVPSGVMDAETVAALNVKPRELLRDIRSALHAWRQSPGRVDRDQILVNLPEYVVEVYRGSKRIDRRRSVIGYAFATSGGRTPLFHDRVDRITINPGWTPSDAVLDNTLLGREARDPGYLERQGFRWFTRPDGRRGVYQVPGSRNALGRVAIRFPNENHIFLHGSPDASDFHRAARAQSHGCIRVEDIEDLAAGLLERDGTLSRAELTRSLRSGATREVRLATPLPIHFEYVRVVVDDDRTVRFLPNVYSL